MAVDHETSKSSTRLLPIHPPIIHDILNCPFPLKSTKYIVQGHYSIPFALQHSVRSML